LVKWGGRNWSYNRICTFGGGKRLKRAPTSRRVKGGGKKGGVEARLPLRGGGKGGGTRKILFQSINLLIKKGRKKERKNDARIHQFVRRGTEEGGEGEAEGSFAQLGRKKGEKEGVHTPVGHRGGRGGKN